MLVPPEEIEERRRRRAAATAAPWFAWCFVILLAVAVAVGVILILVLIVPRIPPGNGNGNGEPCTKTFTDNPTPAIVLEDYTNFDGFIMTMLLQKEPSIDLRLLVVGHGFGNLAPSANNLYNMLAWLRNEDVPIVVGAYHTDQEIKAGANPLFGFNEFGCDVGPVCDGTDEQACLNNPTNERVGQHAQPIFNMFIPPLWKENGATLYGTVGMIPQNRNPARQHRNEHCATAAFVPAHVRMAEVLDQVRAEGKRAIIFHTGAHTDFAKFIAVYNTTYDDVIEHVVVMGGGFFNFANPNDTTSQRWAGNIFSDQAFGLCGFPSTSVSECFGPPSATPPPGYEALTLDWPFKQSFRTMQEFNIFQDPRAAQEVADYLFGAPFPTTWVPTDATDPLLIGDRLDSLATSPTPEGRYVSALMGGLMLFENGNFPFVIRLWDIIAALTVLHPEVITTTTTGQITVNTFTDSDIVSLQTIGCASELGKNPFNVFTYNPYVGQTTVDEDAVPSPITIVTGIDHDLAIALIIEKLDAATNSACRPLNFEATAP